MGSSTDLPDASSPTLILTQATPSERERVWAIHHRKWGGILTLEQYIAREAYLRNVPGQKNDGITHWVLTDSTCAPDSRPILASCDTYRKRALSCPPSGETTEGVAHGIGAVFADPQFRGRGYAGRMMKELGPVLKTWQALSQDDSCLFSVLYSDIGKSFYAKSGWQPFPSSHLSFPARPSEKEAQTNGLKPAERINKAEPIGYHEPAELCAVDEQLLREALPRRARESGRTQVALVPDLESVLWHLMREDFIVKHAFDGRTPEVKGAVYGQKGGRVWAVWTRAYYEEVGTLHFLRFVLEDESQGRDEENVRGIRAVVEVARQQALEWRCREVQTWNPSEKMRELVGRTGLECQFVERDAESIASLMWYGGETGDVDWFYNEKFGWC